MRGARASRSGSRRPRRRAAAPSPIPTISVSTASAPGRIERAGAAERSPQRRAARPVVAKARISDKTSFLVSISESDGVLRIAATFALLVACAIFMVALGDAGAIPDVLGKLSPGIALLAFLFLVLNALAASFRLQIIAREYGCRLSFRQAMAAVGGGSIGGALFFQLAGQLFAQSAILARSGVSAATTVLVTGHERLVAAAISGILALGGAYLIYGRIAIRAEAGGLEFAKIVAGLALAAAAAAVIGYPDLFQDARRALKGRNVAGALLISALSSLIVQLPMMAAYAVLIRFFVPAVPMADLLAATAIIMFAASVPISFAGWGVREMSALLALGVIGVEPGVALVTAVFVGAGSLAAMMLITLLALSERRMPPTADASDVADPARARLDSVLTAGIPLLIATLIPFQLFLPTAGGLVNVNLADPFALLAAAWTILLLQRAGRVRAALRSPVGLALAAMTLALTLSLLIGAAMFGWTNWATTNRYFGWFVLLGYFAAGGLLVRQAGLAGLRMVGLALAGAVTAIAVMELSLLSLVAAGLKVPEVLLTNPIAGFAQNRNAFALQLLTAAALTAALAPAGRGRLAMLAIQCVCLVATGSRAGWGAGLVLLAAMILLGRLRAPDAAKLAGACLLVVGALALPAGLVFLLEAVIPQALRALGLDPVGPSSLGNTRQMAGISIVPNPSTNAERFHSIETGLAMFRDAPLFGAGLGAFVRQELAASGRFLVIHSTPVWLLAELGLAGFLAFAAPLLALVGRALRPARRGDAAAQLVLFLLLVFGTMALVHDMLYQRILWFALGGGVAALLASGRNGAAENCAGGGNLLPP
ncbi:lysylphosphatidylglycerol synthase domain-containing protein [Rhabdaerophilum calidifontis]|uniref:lysylphosphatidylglycerol synthase domain-containing protein n=1 Tax=Rhabdaerophilum calidifontis TaxID=2604328 RepID=UPI00123C489C|nr:lysylphosphatidylglycerol synthase domain-containing protein [Rhabdaerophilum calidifontis]